MKNTSIIGIGKLGLCLALNLEDSGYSVTACDSNKSYIESLVNKTFKSDEPGVNSLLEKSKNIEYTLSIDVAVESSDIIFILVQTPSLGDGKYDHSQIEKVLDEIYSLGVQKNKKTLVVGCTTFPGYCETITRRMSDLNFDIVYNPEFISQGEIINGQRYPDLILIGESSSAAGEAVEKINLDLARNKPFVSRLTTTEAELTKLSINCFITTKISFANMIGDVCNQMGISHENVLQTIGSDTRIGNKQLKWGFGYGGPCFPRDNRALGVLCTEQGIEPIIPSATDTYNKLHTKYQSKHIRKNKQGQIVFDGITYKKNSSIIEESQQLEVALDLVRNGEEVLIIDTESVIEKVRSLHGETFNYQIK